MEQTASWSRPRLFCAWTAISTGDEIGPMLPPPHDSSSLYAGRSVRYHLVAGPRESSRCYVSQSETCIILIAVSRCPGWRGDNMD